MTTPSYVGFWQGASLALGRPVPVDGPYPHICGATVVGTMTGVQVRVWRRDCAACQDDASTAAGS